MITFFILTLLSLAHADVPVTDSTSLLELPNGVELDFSRLPDWTKQLKPNGQGVFRSRINIGLFARPPRACLLSQDPGGSKRMRTVIPNRLVVSDRGKTISAHSLDFDRPDERRFCAEVELRPPTITDERYTLTCCGGLLEVDFSVSDFRGIYSWLPYVVPSVAMTAIHPSPDSPATNGAGNGGKAPSEPRRNRAPRNR